MADDVTFQATVATPPTGTKVATDDVAGVHFQKVKLDVGGDGASVPVAGKLPVGGDVAHDAVDSGNPVKIGGKARDFTNLPFVDAYADRVDAAFSEFGTLGVVLTHHDSGLIASSALAPNDGRAIATFPYGFNVDSLLNVFNGTSWDRLRGDTLGLHISRQATAATATLANVAASVTSVTLQALNASRKGLAIHNDSSAILYVKFGVTASSTSFTVKMAADAYYEVPFGYTGLIDGIWASATGSARMTEMT